MTRLNKRMYRNRTRHRKKERKGYVDEDFYFFALDH